MTRMASRAALLLLLLLPARAAAGTTLLWLPPADHSIGQALEALEKDPRLKLTLALESQPAEPELSRLKALLAEGRVELALRVPEAPPLFLLYYPNDPASAWAGKRGEFRNNPYFFALRLLDARERLPLYGEHPPRGLASSPGGMAEGAQPALRSVGLSWAASGAPASTDTPRIVSRDGVAAVSFDLLYSTVAGAPGYRATAACAVSPCFFVLDGVLDADAGRDHAAALDYWLAVAAPGMTVSELLASTVPASAGDTMRHGVPVPLSLPPWSEDYTLWAGSPRQSGAVSALAGLRDTMSLHMNERPGDRALRSVMQAYFATGAGRELSGLDSPDEEARREAEISFQTRAADVYRLMNTSLPRWIFAPLEKLSTEQEIPKAFTSRLDGRRLELENGHARPSLPEPAPSLPGGLDPLKALKLRSLHISWNDEEVTFAFAAGAGPELGLAGGVRLELYIDVNKRQRAGRTSLLGAVSPRLYPEDAWEYALSVRGGEAELFTLGSLRPAASLKAAPGAAGALSVKVPRRLLAGAPERWGYAAFLFFGDDAAAAPVDALCAENSGGYVHAARHGK
ncbi:MAG: hypothetical protein FD189_1632 [Elusimicrobia bacterium]|nr:MAG: hypothetical protein FD154_916 [Elusimicrobiota bacterium]KAF0154894.1 MAG: hypothetical protein FD189_1632 [Elusimicrobiota bacterium]